MLEFGGPQSSVPRMHIEASERWAVSISGPPRRGVMPSMGIKKTEVVPEHPN
jgi:hypothetical protein